MTRPDATTDAASRAMPRRRGELAVASKDDEAVAEEAENTEFPSGRDPPRLMRVWGLPRQSTQVPREYWGILRTKR